MITLSFFKLEVLQLTCNLTLKDDSREEEYYYTDLFCVAGSIIDTNLASTQYITGRGNVHIEYIIHSEEHPSICFSCSSLYEGEVYCNEKECYAHTKKTLGKPNDSCDRCEEVVHNLECTTKPKMDNI